MNAGDELDASTTLHDEMQRGVRFSILLACMLAELVIVPLAGASRVGLGIGRLVGAVILLSALSVVDFRRATVGFLAVVLVSGVLTDGNAMSASVAVAVFLRLLFYAYVTGVILWRVLRDRIISVDALAGAACAYMLLGLVWAHLFMLLEYARPGSFAIPDRLLVGGDPRPALVYFSFVTLTTVGYGEVHPTDIAAGGACVSEAVVGQLYLAITIARLVGLRVSRHGS